MNEGIIYLLDLNYTLVANQMETRLIRPFSARMRAEEYRIDLLREIINNDVIIITARPEYQKEQTMRNVLRKTGWKPKEAYFNDLNAEPPVLKESVLKRFIFPKYGTDGSKFFAIESNPKTRGMYAQYGIRAAPYDTFIKKSRVLVPAAKEEAPEPVVKGQQTSLW